MADALLTVELSRLTCYHDINHGWIPGPSPSTSSCVCLRYQHNTYEKDRKITVPPKQYSHRVTTGRHLTMLSHSLLLSLGCYFPLPRFVSNPLAQYICQSADQRYPRQHFSCAISTAEVGPVCPFHISRFTPSSCLPRQLTCHSSITHPFLHPRHQTPCAPLRHLLPHHAQSTRLPQSPLPHPQARLRHTWPTRRSTYTDNCNSNSNSKPHTASTDQLLLARTVPCRAIR